jgi:hypothetical protein
LRRTSTGTRRATERADRANADVAKLAANVAAFYRAIKLYGSPIDPSTIAPCAVQALRGRLGKSKSRPATA